MSRRPKKPDSKSTRLVVLGFVPVLAALVLLIGISTLRHADEALSGRGRPGTFTAQTQDCNRSGCTWRGDFQADDGTYRANVQVAPGSGLHAVGQAVRAADVGDGTTLYPLRQETRRDALATIFPTSTVLLSYLVVGIAAVRRRRLPPLTPQQRVARLGPRRVVVFTSLTVEAFVLAWLADGPGPWLFGGLGLLLAWLALMSVRAQLKGQRSLGV